MLLKLCFIVELLNRKRSFCDLSCRSDTEEHIKTPYEDELVSTQQILYMQNNPHLLQMTFCDISVNTPLNTG